MYMEIFYLFPSLFGVKEPTHVRIRNRYALFLQRPILDFRCCASTFVGLTLVAVFWATLFLVTDPKFHPMLIYIPCLDRWFTPGEGTMGRMIIFFPSPIAYGEGRDFAKLSINRYCLVVLRSRR